MLLLSDLSQNPGDCRHDFRGCRGFPPQVDMGDRLGWLDFALADYPGYVLDFLCIDVFVY